MLEKIIQRAIERDPERRYTSAAEMREALAHALTEPVRQRALRRKLGIAAAALSSLALASLVAYGATNPDVISRATSVVTPGIEALARFGKPAPVAQPATPAPPPAAAAPVAAAPAEPATLAQHGEVDEEGEVDDGHEGASAAADADQGTELEGAEPQQVAAAQGGEEAENEEAAAEEAADQGQTVATAAPAADAPGAAEKTTAAEPAADVIDQKIQDAQALMAAGKRVKGFNELRRLGRNNRKDIRVLRAWTDAASQMGAWGEAYRVAQQWASVDRGVEAQLTLARMQKAVGRRSDAIATLRKIIASNPEAEEAKELMRLLAPPKAALAQR